MLSERRAKDVAALLVLATHLSRVPQYIPVIEQDAHGNFGQLIAVIVGRRPDLQEPIQHVARCHDESHAQSRRQQLGQTAHVYDRSVGVGAGQRLQGLSVVMKFVVEVILQDRDPVLAGELE